MEMQNECALVRARAKAQAWLNSFRKVSKWLAQWDLVQLLDEHQGFVKISRFLPDNVAEEALRIVEGISDEFWLPTQAGDDPATNNIRHSFKSTKQGPGLGALFRLVSLLLPGRLHALSAARYSLADGIAPHDDRAFTPVRLDTGQVISCSRDVAVIYYLTKGWTEAMGGTLVDLGNNGARYVPEFNSLVAFQVPRFHQVTAVACEKPRYSIFGWFLQPGRLYELHAGDSNAEGDEWRKSSSYGAKWRHKRRTDRSQGPKGELSVRQSQGPLRCKLARRILANAGKANVREVPSSEALPS